MKINERTEREHWRTKRQRFAYDAGFRSGVEITREETAAVQAANARWDRMIVERNLSDTQRLLEVERQMSEVLRRDLQFANDRIEQLMNSVVIIRDKK